MVLYLVRHAEAARVGGEIVLDADRPLTALGKDEASLMGRALALLNGDPSAVVASPLKRALQTAELIGKEFRGRTAVRSSANLAPGFRHKELMEELTKVGKGGSVVAVGHQPDVGEFLSFLIADSGHAAVAFPPAAVAKVFIPSAPSGDFPTLQWLLTPEAVKTMHPKL